MALPINNLITIPSTSKMYENGKIPNNALVALNNVEVTCRCEPTAARAFTALFAEAKNALGVKIKHVGDYRSFQQQLNLFLDRYIPVSASKYNSTPSAHRKMWPQASHYGYNSNYWIKNYAKFNGWPATAATPGSSNHGRGLAIDIAEEYDGDSAADSIRSHFVNWLCDNAPRYGIYASLQSEPWHWQYVTGDAIPKAVLDYEQPHPPEEEEMIELAAPVRAYDSRPDQQSRVDPARGGVNASIPQAPLGAGKYREIYVGFCNRAVIQITYISNGTPGHAFVSPAGVDTFTACIGGDDTDRLEYGPAIPLRTPGGKIRVKAGPGTFDFIVDVYASDTGL